MKAPSLYFQKIATPWLGVYLHGHLKGTTTVVLFSTLPQHMHSHTLPDNMTASGLVVIVRAGSFICKLNDTLHGPDKVKNYGTMQSVIQF